MKRISTSVCLLLSLVSYTGRAQESYTIQRLTGEIHLDGRSDEAAWELVDPFPITMNAPIYQGEPTERTEIRMAYDDDYLYASGRFYDSDPGGIRASGLSRDKPSDSDDYFGIVLDTFNDNENALVFMTTPAGVRADYAVFDDARFEPRREPYNISWNTFWDVKTVVDETGWFAEVRIPFSSLRFQDDDGDVEMGLQTWRWIGRKAEQLAFPAVPNRWMMGHLKPSVAHDIRLEGVYSKKPLYITPYAISGGTYDHEVSPGGTHYDREDDVTADIGLDVKYGLTSNLTLDLTLNTDFAQVEADDAQVNLTRFSLFFPEKRQFFQERSSIFDVNTGGMTQLFYSRRIGLTEDGDQVRLLGGARVVGRVGAWDVGMMNMQTAKLQDIVPAENFGVYRLRRRILNGNSYAGGIITSRLGNDGSYNWLYGIDGIIRVFGNDELKLNWAQVFDNDVDLDKPLDSSVIRAQWERQSLQGLGYRANYKRVGKDYDPGMGFNLREDFTLFGGEISYGIEALETSKTRTHTFGMEGEVFAGNENGDVETVEMATTYFNMRKSGGFVFIRPMLTYENLYEEFELSDDVYVPIGKYTFPGLMIAAQSPLQLLRAQTRTMLGTFYDGWRVSIGIEPTWNISSHLEIGGELQFNRVRFPDRDQTFKGDVVRVKLAGALNTKISASTYVQYNSADDEATVNFRFRFNPREGNDLYIVYNEGLNTDTFGVPRLPRSQTRALLVKYSYTFIL